MRTMFHLAVMLCLAGALAAGCGGAGRAKGGQPGQAASAQAEVKVSWLDKANAFLEKYFADYSKAELAQTTAYWTASNTGKKEDFDAYAAADLAIKTLHSDKARYDELEELLAHRADLDSSTIRSLELAELLFKENLLPQAMLEQMVKLSAEIEQMFSTYRGKLDGKELSNNDLLELLAKEKASKKRQATWEALKQVGEAVGPKLVALAKLRNEAARTLGYADYWEMKVKLQEHDPAKLLAIFAELEQLTTQPFADMKATLDKELAKKFKVKPEEMMPWHYDNPFFQDAPPSAKIDLDEFYKNKKKEDIADLTMKFYNDIGLGIDDIVARSDLYERAGKNQHAFCIAIDRMGDVRTLLNIKPTADWMDTMLHEEGHAAYYKYLDYSLPFNQRESAHIFTTEAIAMLFGALAKNPTWLVDYAGADKKRVDKMQAAILDQRRREQLIFARWALVMLYFEKALYENPDQDLNKLWWDDVERFQLLKRPAGRNAADWAAKPHFTIAPVYYHNYMLGEVFAAQLRATLAKMAGHTGAPAALSFTGRKDFGELLNNKVFKPGMTQRWPEFVAAATGEELTAKYFAAELK